MKEQNILETLHLSLLNVDDCCARNWNYRNVISPFSRIYLVKSGEGFVIHNQKKHQLLPGRLYLIPSFTLCHYMSNSFLEHYYIHLAVRIGGGSNIFDLLSFENEIEASEEDFHMIKRILDLNPDRKLAQLDPCKYLEKELLPVNEKLDSSARIAYYIETQGILLQLFSRFIKTENRDIDGQPDKYLPNKTISLALEHIHQNLNKPIKISELAQLCYLSDDYFSRLFLKIMGTRPVAYINRKRMESAQMLLIATNEPIEAIAYETGIENLPYFNRMFKKYSCSTPGDYRRLHRLV